MQQPVGLQRRRQVVERRVEDEQVLEVFLQELAQRREAHPVEADGDARGRAAAGPRQDEVEVVVARELLGGIQRLELVQHVAQTLPGVGDEQRRGGPLCGFQARDQILQRSERTERVAQKFFEAGVEVAQARAGRHGEEIREGLKAREFVLRQAERVFREGRDQLPDGL